MNKRATRQEIVLRGDMIDFLDKSKLDRLYAKIIECGQYACAMQQHVVRSFKADGSVLTEADTAISRMIINEIRELFPDAAVISEEDIVENKKDARWIFILDPIDGTDVYSQGMPAFAISLGILNQEHQPVGAMISLPRFGVGCETLNLRMDPYEDAYINGEKFVPYNEKNEARQVTMGSKGMLELDFSRFTGKVRVLGSTIIHLTEFSMAALQRQGKYWQKLFRLNFDESVILDGKCIYHIMKEVIPHSHRQCYPLIAKKMPKRCHEAFPFKLQTSYLIEKDSPFSQQHELLIALIKKLTAVVPFTETLFKDRRFCHQKLCLSC